MSPSTPNFTIEQKIEAILFFKNESVSMKELSKILEVSLDEIKNSIKNIDEAYKNRGIVLVNDGESVSLGTHPDASQMISELQKEELSRELGRAGLETLSIVLYKGPVSRKEIDYIRGVNSGFIIRNLLIRGLVERTDSGVGERSYSYKPTLELLRHLGVKQKEDLPEFGTALIKIDDFIRNQPDDANQ